MNMEESVPGGIREAVHDLILIAQLFAIGTQTVSSNLQRLTRFL